MPTDFLAAPPCAGCAARRISEDRGHARNGNRPATHPRPPRRPWRFLAPVFDFHPKAATQAACRARIDTCIHRCRGGPDHDDRSPAGPGTRQCEVRYLQQPRRVAGSSPRFRITSQGDLTVTREGHRSGGSRAGAGTDARRTNRHSDRRHHDERQTADADPGGSHGPARAFGRVRAVERHDVGGDSAHAAPCCQSRRQLHRGQLLDADIHVAVREYRGAGQAAEPLVLVRRD